MKYRSNVRPEKFGLAWNQLAFGYYIIGSTMADKYKISIIPSDRKKLWFYQKFSKIRPDN